MAKCKGNMIYHFRQMFIEDIGEEEYEKFLETLEPRIKRIYEGTIVSGEMYDLDVFREFLAKVILFKDEETLIRISEKVGEKQLSGFFGMLVKLASYEKIVKNGPKFWKKMFDTGHLEMLEATNEHVKFKISDFVFTEAHMIAFLYYVKRWFELVLNKKIDPNFERADDKTTLVIYKFI